MSIYLLCFLMALIFIVPFLIGKIAYDHNQNSWLIPIVLFFVSLVSVFMEIKTYTVNTTFQEQVRIYFSSEISLKFLFIYLPMLISSILAATFYTILERKRNRNKN